MKSWLWGTRAKPWILLIDLDAAQSNLGLSEIAGKWNSKTHNTSFCGVLLHVLHRFLFRSWGVFLSETSFCTYPVCRKLQTTSKHSWWCNSSCDYHKYFDYFNLRFTRQDPNRPVKLFSLILIFFYCNGWFQWSVSHSFNKERLRSCSAKNW